MALVLTRNVVVVILKTKFSFYNTQITAKRTVHCVVDSGASSRPFDRGIKIEFSELKSCVARVAVDGDK